MLFFDKKLSGCVNVLDSRRVYHICDMIKP